jgi:signal transduction histidine kinase
MRLSIRTALLAVAVLGLVTCGLALYTLIKPIGGSNNGRMEQMRVTVLDEVRRLQLGEPPLSTDASARGNTMRSGYVATDGTLSTDEVPWPEIRGAVSDLLTNSVETHAVATDRLEVGDGFLFVAVAPMRDSNRYAWAANMISPARRTPLLRIVGVALTAVAFALVLSSIFAVLAVRRGADALATCLSELGHDLSAPIPRSNLRELNMVADGIALLARDLESTQRKLADRERLAVLGRVTAGVAHELRNPLAVMKLRIDNARRAKVPPEDMARVLEDVVGEIVRLDRLVNDLLTVAGRRLGDQRNEDIGELARRRADLLRPQAAEKKIEIEVDGTGNARVDGDAIARVIDNILKNAIEASPAGEPVRIDVSQDGSAVKVRCTDSGNGVAVGRTGELFEPFFTTKPEGVGLGLALSRAIAAAHGGTLVYVRDGTTTVFELTLPRAAT